MRDVTGLLLEWNRGNQEAREQLIPLVYKELRKLASRSLRRERQDHTLQPTALVNELYQKLVDQRQVRWQNRVHFFSVASTLMRRLLVDHARRRRSGRRGGDASQIVFDEGVEPALPGPSVDLLALEDALEELATLDPDQAKLVELRFFGGLTVEEAAEVLETSRATVNRDWSMARAWLHQRLAVP